MDVRTLTLANFLLQIALVGVLLFAVYLARRKRLIKHCTVMRIAMPVQIAAIAVVMLPSALSYLTSGVPVTFFYIEMMTHGVVGLGVVVIWIYANLVQAGLIRTRHRLLAPMRLALGLWLINFAIGTHMYFTLWQ